MKNYTFNITGQGTIKQIIGELEMQLVFLNDFNQKSELPERFGIGNNISNAEFVTVENKTEEEYKGYLLVTTENEPGNKHFTTLIYKNGDLHGGTFAGPSENGDSLTKAKKKVDRYLNQ